MSDWPRSGFMQAPSATFRASSLADELTNTADSSLQWIRLAHPNGHRAQGVAQTKIVGPQMRASDMVFELQSETVSALVELASDRSNRRNASQVGERFQ